MPEVSGSEFLKEATRTEPEPREYKLADDQNRYITVELDPIERKDLFNELNRLPSGFLDMMLGSVDDDVDPDELRDVDDPADLDIEVEGSDIVSQVDGSTIDVFETLFSMSASHPDLTSLDIETLAGRLSFEVLFEVGGEIIDLSLQEPGSIKRFREPGSGRSS